MYTVIITFQSIFDVYHYQSVYPYQPKEMVSTKLAVFVSSFNLQMLVLVLLSLQDALIPHNPLSIEDPHTLRYLLKD